MWQEMDAWVRVLGIDPLETIRRATSLPAMVMGRAGEVGMVAAGQVADVIAVPGDPLVRMDVLRAPAVVISRGERVR
jgi:imidazolonepropionase-like amidohydrolase